MSRMQQQYQTKARQALVSAFGYKNPLEVPKLEKIVLNMGVAEAVQDNKAVQKAADDLTRIAGQKAVITRVKKSEARFKIREGMPIGCKVTLRGKYMYEFLDRLIHVAMPRIRDFRGISPKSFDKRGNYAFGIKEHIVFPEIDYDKVDKVRGMDVLIASSAASDAETKLMLEQLDFPFRQS